MEVLVCIYPMANSAECLFISFLEKYLFRSFRPFLIPLFVLLLLSLLATLCFSKLASPVTLGTVGFIWWGKAFPCSQQATFFRLYIFQRKVPPSINKGPHGKFKLGFQSKQKFTPRDEWTNFIVSENKNCAAHYNSPVCSRRQSTWR